uniref:ORF12 n=1 Tax=Yersinia pestis TaxID=632 RepID=Q9RPP1_YERPE|nr:ORF12 [Yersinia pestis]
MNELGIDSSLSGLSNQIRAETQETRSHQSGFFAPNDNIVAQMSYKCMVVAVSMSGYAVKHENILGCCHG